MGKITDEELKSISDLKQEVSQLVYGLGELQYQRMGLDQMELQLKDRMKQLRVQETQVLNDLKEKYGNVSINIETGEF